MLPIISIYTKPVVYIYIHPEVMGLMFNDSELIVEWSMLVSILVLVLHVCVSLCAFIVVLVFTNSIYIYVCVGFCVYVYTGFCRHQNQANCKQESTCWPCFTEMIFRNKLDSLGYFLFSSKRAFRRTILISIRTSTRTQSHTCWLAK